MKSLLLLSFVLMFSTVSSQNPVLNNSFENWSGGEPVSWLTNNGLSSSPLITQDAGAYSGTSALKGEVINFFGTPLAPVLYSAPNGGQSGFPMTTAYPFLNFYYKLSPAIAGDELYAYVNVQNSGGSAMGYGYLSLGSSPTVYTQVSVPVTYIGIDPTNLELNFSIVNNNGTDVGVGTWFLLDELSMDNNSSVSEISKTGLKSPYPNPAIDRLNIPFHIASPCEITIRICDMQGRMIKEVLSATKVFSDGKVIADLADLESGIYQCILTDGTNSSSTLFVVNQ